MRNSSVKTRQAKSPVILVANNPLGHHLLTSQLLDHYQHLDVGADVILLCNGVMAAQLPSAPPWMKVISFATSRGGAVSYLKLLFWLLRLRLSHPRAVYHLRGFVAGAMFLLSRTFLLRSARYIYDPRGAFFVEWLEAGRPRMISRLFGCMESCLVRNSVATVVTSGRFARLYRRLFGHPSKLETIYNSTSFEFREQANGVSGTGKIRIVYLGTFNHWHDMDEICRVMASAARQLGPDRVEIFVYTLPKFHDAVREKFGSIDCASLSVEYVNYRDVPRALADKHVGVSVVRPTLSSRIASPIKVADYVALGLIPLSNSGVGDFDAHFKAEGGAALYKFGGDVDFTALDRIRTAGNRAIYDLVSYAEARRKLTLLIDRLRNA